MSTRTFAPSDSTPDTVVEDLWRDGWFHRTAKYIAKTIDTLDHEDLVTEAVFVAQRASKSHNPEKGDIQAWVKWRAKMEMIRQYSLHAKERNVTSKLSIYEPLAEGGDVTLAECGVPHPSAEEMSMVIDWDTIGTDIRKAIDELTPIQRRYVIARFFPELRPENDGPIKVGSQVWSGVQKRLRVRLSNHKWAVQAARG